MKNVNQMENNTAGGTPKKSNKWLVIIILIISGVVITSVIIWSFTVDPETIDDKVLRWTVEGNQKSWHSITAP